MKMVVDDTSIREILKLIQHAGHTTLVVDEVAVDWHLRQKYGIGLNERVSLIKEEK